MSSHIDKEAEQPLRAQPPPHKHGQSGLMESALEIIDAALKDSEVEDKDSPRSGARSN